MSKKLDYDVVKKNIAAIRAEYEEIIKSLQATIEGMYMREQVDELMKDAAAEDYCQHCHYYPEEGTDDICEEMCAGGSSFLLRKKGTK